jgi:hypothetical protein
MYYWKRFPSFLMAGLQLNQLMRKANKATGKDLYDP